MNTNTIIIIMIIMIIAILIVFHPGVNVEDIKNIKNGEHIEDISQPVSENLKYPETKIDDPIVMNIQQPPHQCDNQPIIDPIQQYDQSLQNDMYLQSQSMNTSMNTSGMNTSGMNTNDIINHYRPHKNIFLLAKPLGNGYNGNSLYSLHSQRSLQ